MTFSLTQCEREALNLSPQKGKEETETGRRGEEAVWQNKTDRQTEAASPRGRETEGRKTEGQTDRQTDRQKDRTKDRKTDGGPKAGAGAQGMGSR